MRPALRHGTETMYGRGCRCEDCSEAARRRLRERRQGIRRRGLPARYDARALLRFFDPEATDITIGEALGVGRRLIGEWRQEQDHLLNDYRADDLATRIGAHPCEVWGDDWWRLAPDEEEMHESRG